MRRSPLLERLLGLADDARDAERLGIDGDELVARRLSRRDLLAGAGRAGLAASALASPVFLAACDSKKKSEPRIAIVGAGIAGLCAARTLARHGFPSTIYESTERVGGHMHSYTGDYWGEGHYSEWCGELIDTDMVVVRGLCRHYGLPLLDLPRYEPSRSYDTYFFFDRYYPRAQALVDFLPVFRAVERDLRAVGPDTTYRHSSAAGRVFDRMSVHEWIQTRACPGDTTRPWGGCRNGCGTRPGRGGARTGRPTRTAAT